MATLSWNEIRANALAFSKRWSDESSEDAEAKSFLDDFFAVFGVSRRRVASFEQKVKKLDGGDGFIDLLWKGNLLIEMKSRGRDLNRAYQQALGYFPGLKDHELPKYVMVSDFANIRLTELETGQEWQFPTAEFYQNIKLFGFIAGYQTKTYSEQDPVNIKAADLMGKLHDKLAEAGYEGHPLKVYLVRLLFCLFAEDTSIFDKQQFQEYIEQKTAEDGNDLGSRLAQLFEVLNQAPEKRSKILDEHLANFRYVNGDLFAELLPSASFNREMRNTLLQCCALDWSRISPAIFGSMFQNVMDVEKRHSLGAHYTSETNILKLIGPLFLDELRAEFETLKTDRKKLDAFHKKLGTLRFLDPACGCGNFLVITYRELRLLEIEVIKALQKGQTTTNINHLIRVDVSQFYGIEYEEFPARIAEVALWLTDHQMNMKVSEEFGDYFARLPLRKQKNIWHGNALRINWADVVPPEELSFIVGNPPFLGHHYQSEEQKIELREVLKNIGQAGVMDYVSAWYVKAAELINGTSIKVGFVSTNSISQGEQVGILWDELINRHKLKIHFAHRTFKWTNEARGKAAVHVVIIGFAQFDIPKKRLFEYDDISGKPHEIECQNINPYLVPGKDLVIRNRQTPVCNVPAMIWGNKPTDGGHFIFDTTEEKNQFLAKEPAAEKWIRPFLSGGDFINGRQRWCLWLKDIPPQELNKLPEVKKRVAQVKAMREASKAEATRKKALTPTLFAQIAQPDTKYLAVPEVSSERRRYIPIAFLEEDVIVSNTIQIIPNATVFMFGILTSAMHMAWVSFTCGRLKSDYRYSNSIVYNNYPWPESVNPKQKEAIEKAAQAVLDIRKSFQDEGSSLADLYDPLTMPAELVKAHQVLDKAVDSCYRAAPFASESKRMEFLFELYEKYTAGLFAPEKKSRKKKK